MRNGTTATGEIKKLHLQEVVLFAINYIPQADSKTLKQFLDLVNAGGTFGAISHEQILKKMHQVVRYIPDASASSLLIVLDLLEIKPSSPMALEEAKTVWPDSEKRQQGLTLAFNKTTPPAMAKSNQDVKQHDLITNQTLKRK